MSIATRIASNIVARENLDFELNESIPRHWYRGDPFKTRILDGLQVGFPDGERYFISSIRSVRERIQDSKLLIEVKDFMRQEGQHGIVHTKYNQMLEKQGAPIQEIIEDMNRRIARYNRVFSIEFNVALTAALEHFTALLAEAFFARKRDSEGSDPRIRAIFAWHAIEEMEHKAVAFDVMTSVTSIGYFRRVGAMIYASGALQYSMSKYVNMMLKADGYSWWQRKILKLKNLAWLYGRNGLMARLAPKILMYMLPGFHPNKIPDLHNYPAWVEEYERSGDPGRAACALYAAAK